MKLSNILLGALILVLLVFMAFYVQINRYHYIDARQVAGGVVGTWRLDSLTGEKCMIDPDAGYMPCGK